jgi:Family of unknown function (DUF6768)
MTNLDQAIRQALSAEDAEFLARFEAEAPLHEQVLQTFRGTFGLLNALGWIAGFAFFAAFLYCAWNAYSAPALRDMLIWGAGATFAMIALGMIKLWFWMELQSNRVLREVKRLELQVARLAAL